MKFKVDENLPVEIAELLRSAQHDAVTVQEQALRGARDIQIAGVCSQEARALVTLDIDFADVRAYPPSQFSGFIVFRVRRQDKDHLLTVFQAIIGMLGREPVAGRLWIVEEHRVRIRGDES